MIRLLSEVRVGRRNSRHARVAGRSASYLAPASAHLGSNHLSGNDKFNPPVQLPIGRGVVWHTGLVLAKPLRTDANRVYALSNQILTNALGALLGEPLVEVRGPSVVRMPFHHEVQSRVGQHDS